MDTKPDASARQITSHNLRLSGWQLKIVWGVVIIVVLLVISTLSGAIPQFFREALHGGPFSEYIAQQGISPSLFFPIDITSNIIQLFVWYSVALFIVYRKPNDRVVLTYFVMILANGYFVASFDQVYYYYHTAPGFAFLNNLTWILDIANYGGSLMFFGTFPDGRFTHRWLRTVYLCLFSYIVVEDLYIVFNPNTNSYSMVSTFIRFIVICGLLIFAQAYRFRSSNPVQRQQTKLVVLALVFGVIGNVLRKLFLQDFGQVLYIVISSIHFILNICAAIFFLLAILRYHLWDIDFAINRSMVYGLLTMLLGAVFVGGFLTLRIALESLVGRQQDLIAVAIPAVAVTALFTPTRNGLRRFVDKRFYGIELDYRKVVEGQALKQKRQRLPGSQIDSFGPYRNLELVGRGGMSEVYRTQHPTLNRDVAIKILSQNLLEDDVAHRRFRHEAQAIALMSHPKIETLYEYNEQDGTPCMILEFLEGQTLRQMLNNKGKLTLAEALPILRDIASALDYAHARGIIHRDIKPSNVIVEQKASATGEKSQRAVLTDFGIAKLYNVTHLTSSGSLLGTLDYVSPEQIHGASEVDARSDIYSFGVMVYELLTGVLPFGHKNPGALVMAHLMQPAPDPREITPDLPETTAKAIMRAMAKEPGKRQKTVGDFVSEMAASEAI